MATVKRLIDANARIKAIKNAWCSDCENYNGIKCRACWVDDAIGLIDDTPTDYDAVEVVRCKDCKYCRVASWGERFCARKQTDGVYAELSNLREDDFCSYGERREGE